MNGAFFSLRPGAWPITNLKLLVVGWLVSEVLVFSLALKLLGFGGTLLLTLGTSILGGAILRRVGLEAARHLRRRMGQGGVPSDAFVDGSLTAIGGVLLVLPGFVSDAIGLALATPSIRQALAARFLTRSETTAAMGRRTRPDVIDLSPDDWRVVDKTNRQ